MKSFLHRLDCIRRLLAWAAVATLFNVGGALAQSTDVDPPDRVARIAETVGQVWLYSPDAGEWIAAQRNQPVTSGDRLATDTGARVELSLGSTTLRLDSGSELEVLRLDDNQVALQLHNGSAAVRIRDARAVGEFELTTDEGRFHVQTAGRYRFDRYDRASHLTVYAGQANFEGPGSALTVYSGQRGEFWLEANGAAQYSLTEPVRDAFASWVDERDRSEDRVVTTQRYVSPEMTGAQDLDRYGRWEQSPDYGPIWYPRGVASGWAPYSAGHWAWVRPWGWTWVDDAPWGFAPFHYGRWVYYRNAWCWTPGTFVARPVYAPALVAWVGGPRANVSVSIGGGGPAVGWFPLAPREVYVPGYRASPRYVRQVNITHVTNVTQITNIVNHPPRDYGNRKFPNAVTVVPTSVLTGRQPVGPSAARLRNLPPVRALVGEPGRAAATVAAPVGAPPPSARGVDARPFRPPESAAGNRGPRGGGAVPTPNAGGDPRRGIPERAPAVRPPVNPVGEARSGSPQYPTRVEAPTNAAEQFERGPAVKPAPAPAVAPVAPVAPVVPAEAARERRGGGRPMPAQPAPAGAAPAAVTPAAPPGAAVRVAPPVAVTPNPAVVAPSTRPVPPPPPIHGAPAAEENQRRTIPRGEREGRRDPQERGRDPSQRAAPSPQPGAVQGVAPVAPRVAVPLPPQVAPRPVRIEPPPQTAPRPVRAEPAAPAVRPAEAPRPAHAEPAAPAAKPAEAPRPRAEPRAPERKLESPARDDRKETGPPR